MIVADQPRLEAVGDGVTAGFNPTFAIFDATHIEVFVNDVLQPTNTYNVTGVGNPAGFTVTFVSGSIPPNLAEVIIMRKQPLAQASVYTSEKFPFARIENDYGKVVMICQMLSERIGRAIKWGKTSLTKNYDIPDPTGQGGRVLALKSDESGLAWVVGVPDGSISVPVSLANGGTAATSAAAARTSLAAAKNGVNSDITQLTGITTPLSLAQGGTNNNEAAADQRLITSDATKNKQRTLTLVGPLQAAWAAADLTIRVGNRRGYLHFVEEFTSLNSVTNPAAGAVRQADHTWWAAGKLIMQDKTIFRCVGEGTNLGRLVLTKDAAGTLAVLADVAKNPRLAIRWAQVSATAADRRIGFYGALTLGSAEPANGIYCRHVAAGNIIAVCRNGGVETTLDTLVAAANGVFHDVEFVVTAAGGNVEVFVDGVSKGNIATNIPTTFLAPHASVSVATLDVGLDVDYFEVLQTR